MTGLLRMCGFQAFSPADMAAFFVFVVMFVLLSVKNDFAFLHKLQKAMPKTSLGLVVLGMAGYVWMTFVFMLSL